MNLQEFYEFVASRRSIRQLQRASVSRDRLKRILSAGRWAPSAHNAQPWRFLVIQKSDMKEKLAKAMGKVFRQDLEVDGEEPELVDDLVQASVDRFSSAPVLVLVCLIMEPMDSYPDEKRQQTEFVMAIQSVAAAIQTILLAAHVEGVGGCWFCAPLFCPGAVQQALGLSEDLIPQALLTLGEADETPEPPIRLPFEEVVRFLGEKEE
jgi:F420 biosynthesis protein FbiB-like protein